MVRPSAKSWKRLLLALAFVGAIVAAWVLVPKRQTPCPLSFRFIEPNLDEGEPLGVSVVVSNSSDATQWFLAELETHYKVRGGTGDVTYDPPRSLEQLGPNASNRLGPHQTVLVRRLDNIHLGLEIVALQN